MGSGSIAARGPLAALRRRSAIIERLEALAPTLLVVAIVLWIALIFAASIYKYENYGQGYDQVDFEQAIWNTLHGRVMEDSRFNFTRSVFGMDWMPMLFFFVPAYALFPSAHTLFFLQIVGSALGAVPLYWLGRDRLKSKVAGLGAGLAYLLYPVLLHGVLNPFQVRLFAVTLLLFGFYYFEKSNWQLFASFALLAMLARSDVALVVAMFGVYAFFTRRRWPYVVLPLLLGLSYFALSTFVILPSFDNLGPPIATTGTTGTGYMSCWPCGHNPQLAYYGHLGSTGPEIVQYIVTHPVDIARIVFTPAKIGYLIALLLPLLFLPLLELRPLVLGFPVLALNLLSLRSSQYSIEHQYSLLIIPGLFAAAIYGAEKAPRIAARLRQLPLDSQRTLRWAQVGAVFIVAWGLVMQVPFKNPAARAFLFHETPAKVQAANQLVSMVPPDAKVAASSFLAPHLLPRRYIYNFPPAPYSPYNLGPDRQRSDYVNLDYILVDPNNSALSIEVNQVSGKSALDLLKTLPDWRIVAQKEGLYLFKRQ